MTHKGIYSICECDGNLATSCETCKEIDDTGKDWCFKWLRQLKYYEAGLETEKAESDRQIHLKVDHTDDKVIDIRYKLAILQTQTVSRERSFATQNFMFLISMYVCISSQPAWILIERIKAHAELHAVNFSHILQRKKLAPKDQRDFAEEINDMTVQGMKNLVCFVEAHIIKMLCALYKTIHDEELEPQNSFKSVEKEWFITLYSAPQAVSQQKEFKVVGPLGERPLHVAALSKDRFGAIDFEREGNYFAKGVQKGIKTFIQKFPEVVTWKDVTMPYGKDYCAAVGNFMNSKENMLNLNWKAFSRNGASFKINVGDPPFWGDLKDWYHNHLKSSNTSEGYSNMLVTRGLYEGETILYPSIAENDAGMVYWLLNQEGGTELNHAGGTLPSTVSQGAQQTSNAPERTPR